MNTPDKDPLRSAFERMWAGLDQDGRDEFLLNPRSRLEAAGVPVVEHWTKGPNDSESARLAALAATGSTEEIRVDLHWWGIDIVMSERLTQDLVNSVEGASAVTAAASGAVLAAGLLPGAVVGVFGSVFAAVVVTKLTEIKIADVGNGVHWPISWLQFALLLPVLALGPAGVAFMSTLLVHPLRN